jgi:cold shock CspA family protein
MERHTGEVVAFDDQLAYGDIRDPAGRTWFFHCTQIADGSRTIAVGTPVSFDVIPGRMGRWEAAEIVAQATATPKAGGAAPDTGAAAERGPTFVCPVCGAIVDGLAGDYEICGVCNWEDDPVQHNDPQYAGGANVLSLHDARLAWEANHGARREPQ